MRGGSRPGIVRAPYSRMGNSGITGTISGTPSHSGGVTTINASAAVFTTTDIIGEYFTDDSTGNSYAIASRPSTSQITVIGDASGETGTFTIVYNATGDPVRMLHAMQTIDVVNVGAWSDNFNGPPQSEIGLAWTTDAIWTDGLPRQNSGYAKALNGEFCGGVGPLVDHQVGNAYPFRYYMGIAPFRGWQLGTIYLHFGMDDSNPDPDDDMRLVLEWDWEGFADPDNVQTIKLQYKSGGGWSTIGATISLTAGAHALGGELCVRVIPTTGTPGTDPDLITIYWNGVILGNRSHIHGFTGHRRFGFGLQHLFPQSTYGVDIGNSPLQLDYLSVRYTPTANVDSPPQILIAAAGGQFYRQGSDGDLGRPAVGSQITLNDRVLNATSMLGIGYIADYDPEPLLERAASDGSVIASSNQFDTTASPDWTGQGIDVDEDVFVIDTGDASGVYTMTLNSGYIALSPVPGNQSADSFSWRILRGPKKYNPNSDTLSLWAATAGDIPVGCHLIARYRSRIVLAGYPAQAWYMSRMGDPLDWDFAPENAVEDLGRAVAGTAADSITGQVGEAITALLQHTDDYLLIGTLNTLWILRGDPNQQGSIDNLSRTVGILSQGAWCSTPEGDVVFLSRDGVYILPAGAAGYPVPWSRESLPDELLISDPNQYDISMAFDVVERGIRLSCTSKESTEGIHYWLDWSAKSFWPLAFSSQPREPHVMIQHPGNAVNEGSVLMGCRDGLLRRDSRGSFTDDTETFSSYIVLGPFLSSGDPLADGALESILAAIPETINDDAVTWEVRVGTTAEDVMAAQIATATATGTWDRGLNYRTHIRRRGPWFTVTLKNTGAEPWSVESLNAIVRRIGPLRKF